MTDNHLTVSFPPPLWNMLNGWIGNLKHHIQRSPHHAEQQVQTYWDQDAFIAASFKDIVTVASNWTAVILPTLFCSWWQQVCNPTGNAGVIWHGAGGWLGPQPLLSGHFLTFLVCLDRELPPFVMLEHSEIKHSLPYQATQRRWVTGEYIVGNSNDTKQARVRWAVIYTISLVVHLVSNRGLQTP